MSKVFYDAIIIGGGFFGSSLALKLAQKNKSVLVLEQEPELLQRASLNNQARVHGGYHYPRHFLTAVRSRINFPRFVEDYRDCVVDDFEKYYAISRLFSKTTAGQFEHFMNRVGAPVEKAPAAIKRLFNSDLIEQVFSVREYAFDAVKLKRKMRDDLQSRGVDVIYSAKALSVQTNPLKVNWQGSGGAFTTSATQVFNCTYSGINHLLKASGVPAIPLKHEITEMALIEMPEEFRRFSVTVMCGPFFSLMPFPSKNLHTLSHVRYTPHAAWTDESATAPSPYEMLDRYEKRSHFQKMVRDSSRYLPFLKNVKYAESLWEVKTLLALSEVNDCRPILYQKIPLIPGLTCIMGGKIDNIYDVYEALD